MGGRFSAGTVVHLTNAGNRAEAVTIVGTDRAERLDFKIDRPLLTLGPGETVNVKLKISGGDVKLVGGADTRPFTIDVKTNSYDTAPLSLSGTYEKRAIVPAGLPVAGATLAALAMGGLFVYRSVIEPPVPSAPPDPAASAVASSAASPIQPRVEPSTASVETPTPALTPTPAPTPPPTAPPTAPPTVPPTPTPTPVPTPVPTPTPVPDLTGPALSNVVQGANFLLLGCSPSGVSISVNATDPSGVNRVTLAYAPPGVSGFTSLLMTKSLDGVTWTGVIPISNGWSLGDLRYHLVGRDGAGNVTRLPGAGDQTIPVSICIG
jgi:hypothetical protein